MVSSSRLSKFLHTSWTYKSMCPNHMQTEELLTICFRLAMKEEKMAAKLLLAHVETSRKVQIEDVLP